MGGARARLGMGVGAIGERLGDAGDGLLRAVDHLDVLDGSLAQLLADDLGQRVVDGLEDVGDAPLGGVELVGRAHARDERHVEVVAAADDVELGGNRVDAVDHIVVLREVEQVGVAGQVEALVLAHDALGVDVVDACLGHIHLALTYG